MAKAYQCDRCQQYYTANKEIPMGSTDVCMAGISYDVRNTQGDLIKSRTFELCDSCLKKIKDFMEFRADFVAKESKITK